MITQAIVDACGLVTTGMAQVHGVGGVEDAETYLVNIALPNNVMFAGIRVSKGKIKDADMLIGMDIITRGDFAVTNYGGVTKFSFRMPSQEHIDFVPAVAQALKTQSLGRPNRAERRRAQRGSRH